PYFTTIENERELVFGENIQNGDSSHNLKR
ncbi:hypothetical protein Ga0451573_003855, partial [Peptococcaceae bacterium DYL19]|nr:hypothetical protein [Phosphitispora fastidiosa]